MGRRLIERASTSQAYILDVSRLIINLQGGP